MLNDEQIAAYREMAKNASENSMEAQIKANLESTCDKFAGNEDKFDRCMAFLNNVCMEMLGGAEAAEDDKNSNCKKLSGEIPDEVCFRICRDYFNDEIWKAEDEEEARKKAEDEERAKEKAEKKSKKNKKTDKKPANKASEKIEKDKAETTKPAPEPEATENEKPVAVVPETTTAEALVKKIAEKNRRLIEENNKKLGIVLAETIDLFGTGK